VAEDIKSLKPAFHRVAGDPDSDFHGFVVIDSFVAGLGTGGVRCTETVNLDEVARLAREITFKFAFLHLPSGPSWRRRRRRGGSEDPWLCVSSFGWICLCQLASFWHGPFSRQFWDVPSEFGD